MTVSLTRSSFMGIPLRKVRDVLKAWDTGPSVSRIANLKAIGMDERTVLAILAESEASGLIGDVACESGWGDRRFGLTSRGKGLAFASGRRRIPRAEALAKLDTVLENAGRVNSDPFAPRHVERIWLFGSMLDEARADVGDIDIVVESRLGPDHVGHHGIVRRIMARYAHLVPPSMGYPELYHLDSYLLRRMLFGDRKDPALAPNDLRTLIDLHVPCRLMFDGAAGGRVDLEVLPHHPQSRGRAATVSAPLEMPDLAGLPPFRPSSVRLLEDPWGRAILPADRVRVGVALRGMLDLARIEIALLRSEKPELIYRPEVAAEWGIPDGPAPRIDGAEYLAIGHRMDTHGPTEGRSRWLLVHRALGIDGESGKWVLTCEFSGRARPRHVLHDLELLWDAAAVAFLIASDLMRLERRQPESDPATIVVRFLAMHGSPEASKLVATLASLGAACMTDHLARPAAVELEWPTPRRAAG